MVGSESRVRTPSPEQVGGVLVGIAAAGVARQVELDDVVGRARGELASLLLVDHVIGRRHNVGQRLHPAQVVVNCMKRKDLCHGGDTLDSLASGRGAAW